MAASGKDPATIQNWVGDLTFKEVHAMTYGFVHGVGAVAAYLLGFNSVTLALVLTLFLLNGWLTTEKTKGFPLVASVYETLPRSIVGQIRDELHYYDGCFILGSILTYGASFLV